MIILGAILFVPLVGWTLVRSSSGHLADVAWEAAARRLKGHFSPGEMRAAEPKSRSIEAEVDGVVVVVDHHLPMVNDPSVVHTRVTAKASAPQDFRLKVFRAKDWAELARAVGVEDVPLGDERFDRAFIVKASDPEAAALWLNAAVRKRLWTAASARFWLKRGKVETVVAGLVTDPAKLVALVRAVAAFADGRQRIVRSWSKLAKRHGGSVREQPERWATLELRRDGVPVVVDTRKIGDHHYTDARAEVATDTLEPFVLANDRHSFQSTLPQAELAGLPEGYDLFARRPDTLQTQLDSELMHRIAELAPAKVRVAHDAVTVTRAGITTKRTDIERAIDLAVSLARAG